MSDTVTFPTSVRTDNLKLPPHSIEAEQAVIGGLLLDNRAWEKIADRIHEKDFYRHDHRLIFRAIGSLESKTQPFDVVTLSESLAYNEELEEVGGLAYLGRLAKDTPSAANIVAYADIVRERSVLRQLIGVGTDIAESGYRPEGRGTTELLETAEKNVFAIAELTKQLLPYLKEGSHVVNISSIGGVQGSLKFPGLAAYSSSKGALITLTELLAEEYKEKQIYFNVLAL